jgi:SlyX protein
MENERLALLEEKLAWLQRHVAEQDRAMLDTAAEIGRLKKQVAELRERRNARRIIRPCFQMVCDRACPR